MILKCIEGCSGLENCVGRAIVFSDTMQCLENVSLFFFFSSKQKGEGSVSLSKNRMHDDAKPGIQGSLLYANEISPEMAEK